MEKVAKDEEIIKEVLVDDKKVNETEVVNEMEELEENEDLIRDWLEESA